MTAAENTAAPFTTEGVRPVYRALDPDAQAVWVAEVREAAAAAGVPLAEVARAIPLGPSAWAAVLAGRSAVTPLVVLRVGALLGVRVRGAAPGGGALEDLA